MIGRQDPRGPVHAATPSGPASTGSVRRLVPGARRSMSIPAGVTGQLLPAAGAMPSETGLRDSGWRGVFSGNSGA
jgi:hypothetical protein